MPNPERLYGPNQEIVPANCMLILFQTPKKTLYCTCCVQIHFHCPLIFCASGPIPKPRLLATAKVPAQPKQEISDAARSSGAVPISPPLSMRHQASPQKAPVRNVADAVSSQETLAMALAVAGAEFPSTPGKHGSMAMEAAEADTVPEYESPSKHTDAQMAPVSSTPTKHAPDAQMGPVLSTPSKHAPDAQQMVPVTSTPSKHAPDAQMGPVPSTPSKHAPDAQTGPVLSTPSKHAPDAQMGPVPSTPSQHAEDKDTLDISLTPSQGDVEMASDTPDKALLLATATPSRPFSGPSPAKPTPKSTPIRSPQFKRLKAGLPSKDLFGDEASSREP